MKYEIIISTEGREQKLPHISRGAGNPSPPFQTSSLILQAKKPKPTEGQSHAEKLCCETWWFSCSSPCPEAKMSSCFLEVLSSILVSSVSHHLEVLYFVDFMGMEKVRWVKHQTVGNIHWFWRCDLDIGAMKIMGCRKKFVLSRCILPCISILSYFCHPNFLWFLFSHSPKKPHCTLCLFVATSAHLYAQWLCLSTDAMK